jgi:hypothetical protein
MKKFIVCRDAALATGFGLSDSRLIDDKAAKRSGTVALR